MAIESAEQLHAEPAYAARPASAWKRIGWACSIWLPALAGLIGWIGVVGGGIDPDPFLILLVPLAFVTSFVASTVIHEVGHYAAVRLVRVKPLCLSIGHGPLLFHKHFADGLTLSIRAIPYSGYVLWSPLNQPRVRWKHFLVAATGPLANVAAGTIALSLAFNGEWWVAAGLSEWAVVFMAMFAFVNGILLLLTLVPYNEEFPTNTVPSDGLSLFNTLFRWNREQPKVDWIKVSEALKRAEDSTLSADSSSQDFWVKVVNADDPNSMLPTYREMLDHSDMPPDVRWHFLDLFATTVLMFNSREFLADADRYSGELVELLPNELTVQGTRGSILIELGQADEGIAMLRPVVEKDPKPFDQAIAAAYLALGEFKKGNLGNAAEWIQKARAFDPNCVPMKRIAATIGDAALRKEQ